MPSADQLLTDLQAVVDQSSVLSPLIRLVLLALAAWCIYKKRIYSGYIAAYIGLVLISTALMAVALKEHPNLFTFLVLFPIALLWGREALVIPPRPRIGSGRLAVAGLLALYALFYPHFTRGLAGPLLSAPLGILPCPTLSLALAAVIATRRSFSFYAVIPTWVVAAFYALVGVLYLHVLVDLVLLAALPVSVLLYLLSPKEDDRPRSKRLRRRH